MFDDFAPRLARILTEYSRPVKSGDYVTIEGSVLTEPLIRALYEAVVRLGGHPSVRAALPGLGEVFYQLASDDQLNWLDPIQMTMIEQTDVWYYIFANANTKAFAQVDPAKMGKHHAAATPFYEAYHRRDAEGSLRWLATAWPTQADAQEAEMGLLAYTEFVYKACALDQADPVAHWQAVSARQAKLCDWLKGHKRVEVRGPGIDLAFDMTGRTWVNADGHVNFPDGEIFNGPVEDSVNGYVAFSYPSVYAGRAVQGVRLAYKDGVIVEASAAKGEDYLLSKLDLDAGARRMGEFAIGTNYGIQQFTGSTLFDEKIGGTIHMAVGSSIPQTGGTNESALHWDMVHDMKNGGAIWVDGALLYQNGQFMIEG